MTSYIYERLQLLNYTYSVLNSSTLEKDINNNPLGIVSLLKLESIFKNDIPQLEKLSLEGYDLCRSKFISSTIEGELKLNECIKYLNNQVFISSEYLINELNTITTNIEMINKGKL